jgi:adhesin/invasin
MAINFLNNVDYNQNQLLHARIENQGSDALAGTPVDGQLYYNTGATPGLKVGENGAWEFVGDNTDTNNYVTGGSIASGTVTLTRQGLASVTFAINNNQITNGAGYITSASLPTVGDGTLTVQGTGVLGGTGTFTANQSGNTTISVTHDALGTAGTYAYPSSVTTNSTGHVTAITAGSAPATPSDATITLAAGTGLTTGGAFTLDQAAGETITFNIGSGDGITVNANDIAVDVDDATIEIVSGEVAAKTAAVVDAGTALATGDQIYDFVTGQIANIPSGLSFEGSWNASTDSPDLSAATPDNGQFWIVSVAGTTDLDGIDEWAVGDWAIYVSTGAGTDGWQKVDNSSTLSGFGDTNQVTYWTSTGNVAGDAGLTYNSATDALTVGGAISAGAYISAPGGNSNEWNTGYDNSITALNVTGTSTKTLTATQQDGGTLTASWTDTDSGGTVTSIATTGPITGGTITSTGTIGITTASAGTIGAGAVAAGTGISVAYASGIATVTNTQTNSANTYAETIADTDLTIDHGLNTTDVMVQLFDITTGETVYADVDRISAARIGVTFASTPTNSIRVLVQKIG